MIHDEMIALIQNGVRGGTIWAELGAGAGNFTTALRTLLGDDATIYAVDHDARSLKANRTATHTQVADFTAPLDLPPLDGVLMANALHWTRHQAQVMEHIYAVLREGGQLVVVEYDVTTPRPFMIPHPVPFSRFEQLAQAAEFVSIRQIGRRVSPRSGMAMNAMLAEKPKR